MFRRSGWALALAAALAAPPARAGTLQVQVQDGGGKPLADAVVFLESREARALARPMAHAEVVQKARQFQPSVTVVTLGTAVSFPNQDTVRHHVYSFSPAKTFELKLYVGTPASPVVFDKTGIAVLGCNIHDQMVAWIVVVDTPYHASSDAAGSAILRQVPPGQYRLRVWHSSLPVGAPASEQALAVEAADQRLAVKLAGTQP